jgi:hypothetical protein
MGITGHLVVTLYRAKVWEAIVYLYVLGFCHTLLIILPICYTADFLCFSAVAMPLGMHVHVRWSRF